ncbi:MAG: hypothetical protein AAGJ46_17745 [Planctomycetota bacterium]
MPHPFVSEVLEHIRTYRLTTVDAVTKLFSFDDSRAAASLLKELRSANLVAEAELSPGQVYYHLLPQAAELLRLGQVEARPLAGVAKAEAYAKLHFCCLQEAYRPLIPADRFRSDFGSLYRPGPRISYYTAGQTLGYLRVETKGMTGDPYRVLEYCRRDLAKRVQWKGGRSKEFSDLVEAGRFVVTVLVAAEGRAERLRQEVDRARERSQLYNVRAEDIKKHGDKYGGTWEPAFIAYKRWHRNDKEGKRKPPRMPPPMNVAVVPGLMDLIYPKVVRLPADKPKELTRKQKRRRARKRLEKAANAAESDA